MKPFKTASAVLFLLGLWDDVGTSVTVNYLFP